VGEFESRLEFDGLPSQTVHYQAGNQLLTAYEYNTSAVPGKKDLHAESNMYVTCEDHQNLTPAAKLLLQWHCRLGHKKLGTIRLHPLMRQLLDVYYGSKFAAAAKCAPLPRCAVCEYAKGHRKPTHGKTSTPNTEQEGALKVKTRHVRSWVNRRNTRAMSH
jgi:hypothetical protein